MLINRQTFWAPEDTQAVAKTQNVLQNGFVNLNGNLARPANVFSFNNYGWCRIVSVSSTDNITAATITVRGYQNGLFVEDAIAGPNATKREGTVAFDTITEIQVTGAVATNMSIGSGNIGFFSLQEFDIQENYTTNFSAQMIVYNLATFNYSFLFSCSSSAAQSGSLYSDLITAGVFLPVNDFRNTSFTGQTTSKIYLNIAGNMMASLLVQVNNSVATDKAKFVFLQGY